jgi:flagellar hook-associated protein 2
VSTPITMSGFNGIDFTVILNSLMEAEKAPLTALQTRQSVLKAQSSAFASLATKISALAEAAASLNEAAVFSGREVSSTDESVVSVSGSEDAPAGMYDVVVQELARAQVTTSASLHDDTDTTAVATGGSIVVGGVKVTLSGSKTLQGLANAINATDGIPVRASIVSPATGKYQLVLTGKETGTANGFTIDASGLTGSTLAFTDTDADGVSGDSAEDNRMQALNAQLLVNNVTVSSATNTVEGAIPGTTLTLRRKSTEVVGISVTGTSASAEKAINDFVSAFNGLGSFITQQKTASSGLGRDPLLRSLQNELRNRIGGQYAAGGSLTSLAAAGIGFSIDGKLKVDKSVFSAALDEHVDDLKKLFLGDGEDKGVFETLGNTLKTYTDAGALIENAQDRIDSQIAALDWRLASEEARLSIRRASLQQEMIAADMTISQLKSQSGTLSSLGSSLS